jgi:hypothetical protein
MRLMILYTVVALCAFGAVALGTDAGGSTLAPGRGVPGKTCDTFKNCEDCIASHFCSWSEKKKFCFDQKDVKPEDEAYHKCPIKEKPKPAPRPMKVQFSNDENERSLHTVITAGIKDDLNGVVSGEAITIERRPKKELNYTTPEYRKVWMTPEEVKKEHEEAEKQAWTLKGQVEPKRLPTSETWQRYTMRRQVELADEDKAREREDPSTILTKLSGAKSPDLKAKAHPLVKADPINIPNPEKATQQNATGSDQKEALKQADAKAEELVEKAHDAAQEQADQVTSDDSVTNSTAGSEQPQSQEESPAPNATTAEPAPAQESPAPNATTAEPAPAQESPAPTATTAEPAPAQESPAPNATRPEGTNLDPRNEATDQTNEIATQ